MNTKNLATVALLLLAVGVLSACGEQSAPASEIKRPAPPGGAVPSENGRPAAPPAPDQ